MAAGDGPLEVLVPGRLATAVRSRAPSPRRARSWTRRPGTSPRPGARACCPRWTAGCWKGSCSRTPAHSDAAGERRPASGPPWRPTPRRDSSAPIVPCDRKTASRGSFFGLRQVRRADHSRAHPGGKVGDIGPVRPEAPQLVRLVGHHRTTRVAVAEVELADRAVLELDHANAQVAGRADDVLVEVRDHDVDGRDPVLPEQPR